MSSSADVGAAARRRFSPARRRACAALALVGLLASHPGSGATAESACADPPFPVTRRAELGRALQAKRDVLGERVLDSPEGPTYEAVRRLLPPLFHARGPGGRSLTESGAYYLTFAMPYSLYGEKAFALHVADGSQILTRRSNGPRLSLFVGDGRERYGSCLVRLGEPRLTAGYLPILRTSYVDASGVRYRQESFASRIPGVRSLVSFVRLEVDTRSARRSTAVVRLVPSADAGARLAVEGGGSPRGTGVTIRVDGRSVVHAAWVHSPTSRAIAVDAHSHGTARRAARRFWEAELARGTTIDVPDRRVSDAVRNLLIQQRILTWRYSVGNTYEELSFAEALDAAQVMAGYGSADVSEAIIRFALRRLPVRYTNWRAGEVLLATATHVRLAGDASLVTRNGPALEEVLDRLERQIQRPGGAGLLDREQYSSDIRRHVLGLHGQAVVWQGLLAMGGAWERSGRPRLAARATAAAHRLETALRSAIRASKRTLPDGSLFVPTALLDDVAPFDRLTASREGSYWNLVMPYALASGLFPAGGADARGIGQYMRLHGSALLGLVRASADRLYRGAPYPSSGIDQVYGLNVARFLADADQPDQLVLSMVGTLAGAMTPNTFVAGEAATVIPLDSQRHGAMYLPPNGGTNSAFLETVRLALVHERRGPHGAPTGLDLAFATPRGWLSDGDTIRVRRAPTSFGPVSYTMARRGARIDVRIVAPPTSRLRLRVRLPGQARVGTVAVSGSPVSFDAATGTIDLSGRGRDLQLVVRIRQ